MLWRSYNCLPFSPQFTHMPWPLSKHHMQTVAPHMLHVNAGFATLPHIPHKPLLSMTTPTLII
jgi:hypothetical protein